MLWIVFLVGHVRPRPPKLIYKGEDTAMDAVTKNMAFAARVLGFLGCNLPVDQFKMDSTIHGHPTLTLKKDAGNLN